MAILTIERVVRGFTARMGPHLHHQNKWRPKDGGLYCSECEVLFVTPRMFVGASALTPAANAEARDRIARWMYDQSPGDQKLIFKV